MTGVHGADVHLVAVALLNAGAVVAHCDGQEMEHQVRVLHIVITAGKAATFEVIGSAGTFTCEQPRSANEWTLPQLQVGIVTRKGFVFYYGLTSNNQHHSIGAGFYTGYQQFRVEYSETLKSISFGCGYILK